MKLVLVFERDLCRRGGVDLTPLLACREGCLQYSMSVVAAKTWENVPTLGTFRSRPQGRKESRGESGMGPIP